MAGGGGTDKGGAPVCCFPLLSSSFRKGVYLINTVRSGVRFHLGKEQEERERKSLKTTKDQNMTVLTLFFKEIAGSQYCSIVRIGLL